MAPGSDSNRTGSARRIRVRTERAVGQPHPGTGPSVERVLALLAAAGHDREAALEVLGSALTQTAIAPYWTTPDEAADAHAELANEEPELAEAVEALAPWLIGRAEQRDAISAVEDWLGA